MKERLPRTGCRALLFFIHFIYLTKAAIVKSQPRRMGLHCSVAGILYSYGEPNPIGLTLEIVG